MLEKKLEKLLALTSLLHHDQETETSITLDDETTKPFPSVNETGNSTAHNATEVFVTVINEDDTNEDELEAGNFNNSPTYFLNSFSSIPRPMRRCDPHSAENFAMTYFVFL